MILTHLRQPFLRTIACFKSGHMARASGQGQAGSTLCRQKGRRWRTSSKLLSPHRAFFASIDFGKVSSGDEGRNMVSAEFESMKALHAVIATNIPLPIAWGTFVKEPDKHFYLANFCDMEDELPPISEFTEVMASLHQKSVSPTGEFGFHCTTYGGNQPVDNTWCSSWEEFYTRAMRNTVKNESLVQGPSEELNRLTDDLCTKVIPRLLRPLETGGRSIKPSLVHGDLWHGNVGIDIATNDPILFDACSLYAHNECKLTVDNDFLY